jgi:hypothetical protein
VHGFRFEAAKMTPFEKGFFRHDFDEMTLKKPCQIETFQFQKPYRFVMLCFLDRTKPDLTIRTHKARWSNLNEMLGYLLTKYPTLSISQKALKEKLEHCRVCPDDIVYGIDVLTNVLILYFTSDPRRKRLPLPVILDLGKPSNVAEMVFQLNLGQTSSYFCFKGREPA